MRANILATAFLVISTSPAIAFQPSPQLLIMASDAPVVATELHPLLLNDTLSAQRSLSIFASLTRDDLNTSRQFADKGEYTIVLAPTNTAMKAMGHKPWEDPEEAQALGGQAYKGDLGMDRAQRNIRRFVQACLVTTDNGSLQQGQDWREGEKRARSDKGTEVWWEVKDGKRVVMPEGIQVEGIVSKVANGEVWALDGTFQL